MKGPDGYFLEKEEVAKRKRSLFPLLLFQAANKPTNHILRLWLTGNCQNYKINSLAEVEICLECLLPWLHGYKSK